MARRKNWDSGNVVEITLSNGRLSYAQVIDCPLVQFFDGAFPTRPDIQTVVQLPVAFTIWVMKYAIGKRYWGVVDSVPLSPEVDRHPWFFKQDIITRAIVRYRHPEEIPATRDEVLGLECAAVWDPEHVVSRLDDHYAGRINQWVQSLAITAS